MPESPRWRETPEHVWISCEEIDQKLQPFEQLGELIVQFKINGATYTAFVPRQFVNPEKNLLQAVIVADYGADILIDIPTDTLTSGSRLRVPESEKDTILVSMKGYGT